MRFTWPFLLTVTIDLPDAKASDVPGRVAEIGRLFERFRDEPRLEREPAVDRPSSTDDCVRGSVLRIRTMEPRPQDSNKCLRASQIP